MPPEIDPTAPAGAEGTAPPTGTEPPAAEDPTAKLIEDYRKRQAGAEKARQEAERSRDAVQAELDALKRTPKAPAKSDDPAADVEARLAAMQADFNRQLADRTAEVQGKALDARFPVARAKFPEVTDPVKLAELEGFLSEPENPTPVGNNAQRGNGGAKNIEDMSSKELQAYMRTLDPSVMGLSPDR